MTRRIGVSVAALAGVVALSSCAALDVNSLPQPGNSYRDGYDITLEFEDVLNLPDRAKIELNGVAVGVVTQMTMTSRHVDVTARISPGVVVPSNAEAAMEQATVLGDIYIAIDRPQGDASQATPLDPGGRIPLAQTTSPPQLEDTLASLATFVGSGSIQRAQNTVIRLNRLTPPSDEVRRLSSRVVDDLSDLSDNIDQVDQLLAGVSRMGEMWHSRIPQIQLLFSPSGQLSLERIVIPANTITRLLPGVGSVAAGGFWLVPFLNSMATTVGAIQRSKINVEEEVPKYRRLFTDFFIPQDKYPAINITSIVGPDGRELSGNVEDVLRILGAMP
ncbi:mammalian cell entry protein [Mycolicibacterium peregrinum]|uniref:MlaD family protein n=1 Tax=Mycolicibacterium peregrinum TaxID=43304 RepID=UPI0007EB9C92|nr:MlaD family protein [Mycolicibacterium peregrinum]OBF41914.1 mammalian cell entry protein [Mycolicibacterium peregrinum]